MVLAYTCILRHWTLVPVVTGTTCTCMSYHKWKKCIIIKQSFFNKLAVVVYTEHVFLCVLMKNGFDSFNHVTYHPWNDVINPVMNLTGYVRDDHMVVSSCFTTAPFSELKAGHLEGIRGLYADNCKCRVRQPVSRHEVH